jgi:hypothetical protein
MSKQISIEEIAKNGVAKLHEKITESNEAQIGPMSITFTATGQIVLQFDNGNISFWEEKDGVKAI